VLCPTDFSPPASHAIHVASGRYPDAELVLLHVVDPSLPARAAERTGLDEEEVARKAWNDADVRLREAASGLAWAKPHARALLVSGDPIDETLHHAETEHADLICLGVAPVGRDREAREGGFRAAVAKRSRVPIWLIPLPEA
jgi:nucleotide-binding universal stress UspA family protein